MRTDVRFGEINPFHATYVMNMEEHNPSSRPRSLSPQAQSIDSSIRTDTYKLGWDWKPENSRWIDLQANLWRIKTDSTRATRAAAWNCLSPAPTPITMPGTGVPNADNFRPIMPTTTAAAAACWTITASTV